MHVPVVHRYTLLVAVVHWYFKIAMVVFNTTVLFYGQCSSTPLNYNNSGLYRLFQYCMLYVQ
jgi:hypothetical protein